VLTEDEARVYERHHDHPWRFQVFYIFYKIEIKSGPVKEIAGFRSTKVKINLFGVDLVLLLV